MKEKERNSIHSILDKTSKTIDDNTANNNLTSADRTKIAFLAWAPSSPRAEGLATSLDATLVQLSYKFKKKIYSPFKYPLLFFKSIAILRQIQPQIVICQEPPVFCTISAMMYRYFSRLDIKIVIDAHTAAFHAPWSHFRNLHKRIFRRANIVIVTSDRLREFVFKNYGINTFILQDKIPCIKITESDISSISSSPTTEQSFRSRQGDNGSMNTAHNEVDKSKSSFKAVAICSFAPDEPIKEILEAAKALPKATFYITGDNSQVRWLNKKTASTNIIFTGYLNKEKYFSLLREADIIIALTKRDNTMLSGAHEALALSKPLITSSWPVLKSYFDRGTIHVNNDPIEIKNAIVTAMIKESQLEEEIKELREIRKSEWNKEFDNFKMLLFKDITKL